MATDDLRLSTSQTAPATLSGSLKLPSADSPFARCQRPATSFLGSLRRDLETPMHATVAPKGFGNPNVLCYRNAILIALLNTNRVLSYLFIQVQQLRAHCDPQYANQKLVARLYHLATAYWDPDGLHPLDRSASYEKMCTMFWRSCKYSTDMSLSGNQTWLKKCDYQLGEQAGSAYIPLHRRQQDAADFLQWLVETMCCQPTLVESELRGENFGCRSDALFHVRTTMRLVCHRCSHPVRRRIANVDVQIGLKVSVVQVPRSDQKQPSLIDYLEAYFNEQPNDKAQCLRCMKPNVDIWKLRRLQSTPEVLVVHLTRGMISGGHEKKSLVVVDIPQYIDVSRWLEPHVFAADSKVIYQLTAVVSHRGKGLNSGHYIAHVRNDGRLDDSQFGQIRHVHEKQLECVWARVNDSNVSHNFDFTRISNTSESPSFTSEHLDWFDPVLVLYEKCAEKYETDGETNERVFQKPMNIDMVDDQPLEDALPSEYIGDSVWAYE